MIENQEFSTFHKLQQDLMHNRISFFLYFELENGTILWYTDEDFDICFDWRADLVNINIGNHESHEVKRITYCDVEFIEEDVPQFRKRTLWNKKGTVRWISGWSVTRGSCDGEYRNFYELICTYPFMKVYDWRLTEKELKENVFKKELMELKTVLDNQFTFHESPLDGEALELSLTLERQTDD